MFPIRARNRRAITPVLTSIIILVASIVMGSSVAVYSTGLFQSGGQQQAVQIGGTEVWVNNTYTTGIGGPGGGIGWGAFAIKNTGDKILSVSSIAVRGAAVPFTNWFVDIDPTRVSQNFQAQFAYTKNDSNGHLRGTPVNDTGTVLGSNPSACVQSSILIKIQLLPKATNSPVCLAQQSGPVALNPGQSAIFYYKLPVNLLTPSDSGITSTINILAGTAPVSQTIRISNPEK